MPLEIYKVLGQVKSTGSPQDLYTVPANAMAKVYVTVSSSDTGTHQFTISVSKNGAATANGDSVYDQIDLAKNTSFTTSTFTLSAGDIIRVDTDGTTNFTFQAHGVEIYTSAAGVYFDLYENGTATTVRLYNLEQNLTYLNYTEEDTLLRIGFTGYGSANEVTVDFPSDIDRLVFVQALEQARLYGTYDGVDPVTPMINIGSNLTIGGVTTTSTTTTTTAPATTTTTTATPTTTTSTTSTTTTTTAGPPILNWDFSKESTLSASFRIINTTGPNTLESVTSSGSGSLTSPDITDGDIIELKIITGPAAVSAISVVDHFTGDTIAADVYIGGGLTITLPAISNGDVWDVTSSVSTG